VLRTDDPPRVGNERLAGLYEDGVESPQANSAAAELLAACEAFMKAEDCAVAARTRGLEPAWSMARDAIAKATASPGEVTEI